MSRATKFLCLWLVLVLYIQKIHAATKVFYEFHINDAPNNYRNNTNETGVLEDGKTQPELIINGSHTSSILIPGKDPNSTDYLYTEKAVYKADDSGYHVQYNYSLEPMQIGTRLGSKALKVIVG